MVRVLVLGATGYIGLATAQALRRCSHIVFGLARSPAKAKELAQNEILPVLGSVEDGQYLSTIDSANIDVVIDAASTREGSHKVLADVKKLGEERLARRGGKGPKLGFIYLSGTWVHGSGNARLNDLNPVAAQGDSGCPTMPPELVAWRPELENKILEASGVLDVMVLRPGLLYGRSCAIWGIWFQALREAAVGKKEFVELQCNEDAIMSLVHVDEVGDSIVKATEQLSKVAGSSVHPVFDITTSREPLKPILNAVAREMGFTGDLRLVRPTDPFPMALSTSARLESTRLRDLLGWSSRRQFGMLDEIEVIVAAWLASNE